MTNTRAASATVSLRAKQELVRLLFGNKLSRKGPQAHRLLDHSIYSYADLRTAYLERIHVLHPDKKRSQDKTTTAQSDSSNSAANGQWSATTGDENNSFFKTTDTSRFVELQEAWNRYEEVAKMMKKVGQGSDGRNMQAIDANFTMFGVGCSFSDNDEEREMRNRIMDQASRGWFTAGELSERTAVDHQQQQGEESSTSGTNGGRGRIQQSTVSPLTSDDMFDLMEGEDHDRDRGETDESRAKARFSLISHLIPPHKR